MPKALGASKVSSKFQVTVPEAVREKLKVKVGDTLIFVEQNGKVIITIEVF
jgi:AbrB family looped-hinge helix DNA binding protein